MGIFLFEIIFTLSLKYILIHHFNTFKFYFQFKHRYLLGLTIGATLGTLRYLYLPQNKFDIKKTHSLEVYLSVIEYKLLYFSYLLRIPAGSLIKQ